MNNSAPWGPVVGLLIFFGLYAVLLWYLKKKRRDAMAGLASQLGLIRCGGDSLPDDLSLRGTEFAEWEKVFNAYQGVIGGKQVMVFDLRKGWGRNSWARTVIGLKTPEAVMKDWYGFDAQRIGNWVVFSRPASFFGYAELTSVDEVEKRLLALGRDREVTS